MRDASRIDFAPNSFSRALRQADLFAWASFGVAIILLGAVVTELVGLSQSLAALEAKKLALSAAADSLVRPATQRTTGTDAGPSAALVVAANKSIGQLNIPWSDLFRAVELAASSGVAVLVFEPDARKAALRLTVEARSLPAVFAFADRLRDQPISKAVRLVRHEVNAQDKNRPVRFQLELQWKEVNE
jgi:hypothetical protein